MSSPPSARETVWILGDQLMEEHPALSNGPRDDTVVLMIESRARGSTLRYHQAKLALVYAAMRHRAAALRTAGWRVDYHALSAEGDEDHRFEPTLRSHCERFGTRRLRLAPPNSHLESDVVRTLAARLGLELDLLPDTPQFLRPRTDFAAWARGRTRLLMEEHYRDMRKRHGWLMTKDGTPEGGVWNTDRQNRASHAAWRRAGSPAPMLPAVEHDAVTRGAIEMVERRFADHPGRAADLWLPVDRPGAKAWLHAFIADRLPLFGTFEDMMSAEQPYLLHSVLSPFLNLGLLTPRECVEAAIAAYDAGTAPLNAVEGYVRQVIGWREFVNGVYWLRGPTYAAENQLAAHRPLPPWFATGDTPMRCLHVVLTRALGRGWNHHIERLMVIGNFLALADVDPAQSLRWFSEIYVDAYDWVMPPNVIGLSQHADGGFMATKPYLSGGNYIDRMSDFCSGCAFDPRQRRGPRACPFNLLYWEAIARHADRWRANARLRPIVAQWEARPGDEQRALRAEAAAFLEQHVPRAVTADDGRADAPLSERP